MRKSQLRDWPRSIVCRSAESLGDSIGRRPSWTPVFTGAHTFTINPAVWLNCFQRYFTGSLLYNVPFLGLNVNGQTCLLATDARGKADRPVHNETGVFLPTDYTPRDVKLPLEGVRLA